MTSWFEESMLAYDHSYCSAQALEIFLDMKQHFSKSHVLHVFNPKKSSYTPISVSSATISEVLKQKIPPESNENFTIELRDQNDKTVNDSILESLISNGLNFLFLGFVGSKGFKPRAKDFSSRVSQFVYESKVNLAIVKRENPKTGKVLFLFDGSEISVEGLLKASEFCKTFNLSLTVLHCTSAHLKTHSKFIRNLVKSLQSERKAELVKFSFECQNGDVVDWVKQRENDFEWVIMNSNGHRGSVSKKRFVGHNTTAVLEEVNSNLIIIKE